jgi:lipopolysaccharide transport system permease protein
METSNLPLPELVIEPSTGWVPVKLGDLWEYREVLYFLSWRDVKLRYQQTFLGVAWAVIQPLLSMVVFTLFFGRLAKIPSDGMPYSAFALTALVPWTFFANGLGQASMSLVANANLVKKVYFPRLALPLSSILAGLVDFVFAFGLLIVFLAWQGIVPGWNVLWLPSFVLLSMVAVTGVGLWLAALNAEYRDVKYIVQFLTQLWMLATPIAYPSSLVPAGLRPYLGLNPMAGVVEGFRWALLGRGSAPSAMLAISWATALVLLVSGAYYFRRMERNFADVV